MTKRWSRLILEVGGHLRVVSISVYIINVNFSFCLFLPLISFKFFFLLRSLSLITKASRIWPSRLNYILYNNNLFFFLSQSKILSLNRIRTASVQPDDGIGDEKKTMEWTNCSKYAVMSLKGKSCFRLFSPADSLGECCWIWMQQPCECCLLQENDDYRYSARYFYYPTRRRRCNKISRTTGTRRKFSQWKSDDAVKRQHVYAISSFLSTRDNQPTVFSNSLPQQPFVICYTTNPLSPLLLFHTYFAVGFHPCFPFCLDAKRV